jgi:hypothetical protein
VTVPRHDTMTLQAPTSKSRDAMVRNTARCRAAVAVAVSCELCVVDGGWWMDDAVVQVDAVGRTCMQFPVANVFLFHLQVPSDDSIRLLSLLAPRSSSLGISLGGASTCLFYRLHPLTKPDLAYNAHHRPAWVFISSLPWALKPGRYTLINRHPQCGIRPLVIANPSVTSVATHPVRPFPYPDPFVGHGSLDQPDLSLAPL